MRYVDPPTSTWQGGTPSTKAGPFSAPCLAPEDKTRLSGLSRVEGDKGPTWLQREPVPAHLGAETQLQKERVCLSVHVCVGGEGCVSIYVCTAVQTCV